jgi:hypothetical protein
MKEKSIKGVKNMKRFIKLGLIGALGFAIWMGMAQAQAEQREHKVAICHGTASDSNPYVLIVVDVHALNGHFDGTAPGHGKNNYPDFFPIDGTCDIGNDDGGDS